MPSASFPCSIAIAGAWGYIGRRFVDAALELGLRVYTLDPVPVPDDLDLSAVDVIGDAAEFYLLDADFFHLALHPEHRGAALAILLRRAAGQPLAVLNEKPMAPPEQPGQCPAVIKAVEGTRMVMLFDFLELYDPMVHAIARHLSSHDRVEITDVTLYRGKDREDPGRPRNYKRMVHIQYQESVHCMAFLLYLLGHLRGDLAEVFADGIRVTAHALPYAPANPGDYPYVVDGRCTYTLELGDLRVEGCTDFKAGAEFARRKVIRGRADGRPFTIEADTQEGRKYLRVDGQDQGFAADASSYRQVISTLGSWYLDVDHRRLMGGVYPHPRFAFLAYQLSSALWRSCWTGEAVTLASAGELTAFDAGFAAAVPEFPRYSTPRQP